MGFANCFSLLVPMLGIFPLITNPAFGADPQTQQRIDKICRQMEKYGFCNKIFNDNLKNPSTDYIGLTQITIEQVTKYATSTHDNIVQLLQKTTDAALKNVLIACENGYHIVQQSFQDASKSFYQKDYEGMVTAERIAPRAQASCETSFSTPPSPHDVLSDRNRQCRVLIAMAVVTGHELAQ